MRSQVISACSLVISVFSASCSEYDQSNYFGGKGRISRCLATVHFSLMVDLGTVMAALTVSFSLLICYNELMLSVKG